MDELEYTGLWWLPHNEDKKISGILRFSKDDVILLKLIGTYEEIFDRTPKTIGFDDFEKSYQLIVGVTHTGKKVTLHQCQSYGWTSALPGFESQSFEVKLVFWGFHANTIADLCFKEFEVGYTYLADWVGIKGMRFHVQNYANRERIKYELSYSFPNEVKSRVFDDDISISREFKTSGNLLREVHLKEIVRFKIATSQKHSLEELWLKYVSPLQNFLTFATHRKNSIVDVYTYSELNQENATRSSPIQVFFRNVLEEAPESKELMPDDILFGFYDIEFDLSKVLTRWFEMNSVLKGVFDLFFIVQYLPEMYLPSQFLNIVLAIEGYHRKALDKNGKPKFVNEEIPVDDYQEFKKQIIRGCPSKFKEILYRKLQYNEISLKKRILEVTMQASKIIPKFISDPKAFAKRVVFVRNAMVHQSPGQNYEPVSSLELFWTTQSLMYLLRANFLSDLSFSDELSSKLFNRNQRFLFAANEIKKYSFET